MTTTAAAIQNKEMSMSERFSNLVMREFASQGQQIQINDYQRQLIQGYFIVIDRALKMAEEARERRNAANKDKKYNNNLPFAWANVNLNDLALDVMHYAKMGLDMMQDNHLYPIPFKNNKTNKYDLTLMPGYNGIQYIAEKYALEKTKAVTIEVVYSTDKFKPIKKGRENQIESYEFEITNPFDRGEIVGGFGYIEYPEPQKNELVIMSAKDILKRRPKHAAAEFWGGKQKTWENGRQVERDTDGWFAEMCIKTLKREVYSAKHIPRDPRKIDDSYQYAQMREVRVAQDEMQQTIDINANTVVLEPPALTAQPQADEEIAPGNVDMDTGEILESEPEPEVAADEQGPSF